MSIVRTALLVVAALGLSALVAESVNAVRIMRETAAELRPPRVHVTPEEEAEAGRALLGKIDTIFRASDGTTLRGWYAPSRTGAAVVLTHGLGANRVAVLPEAEELAARGYGVLLFDSRAHGDSDGDHCTWGDHERRDLTAALDWITARPEVDRDRVGVLGFSIGGITAALLAPTDAREHALVLEATGTALGEQIRNESKWGAASREPELWQLRRDGIDVDAIDPVHALAVAAPRPVLFVAGQNDPFVPESTTNTVFAAAPEPKQLYVVPGATHGHYTSAVGPAYAKRVADFFDDALRAKTR